MTFAAHPLREAESASSLALLLNWTRSVPQPDTSYLHLLRDYPSPICCLFQVPNECQLVETFRLSRRNRKDSKVLFDPYFILWALDSNFKALDLDLLLPSMPVSLGSELIYSNALFLQNLLCPETT